MKKLSVTLTGKEQLLGWIYYPLQLLGIPFLITWVNLLLGEPLTESGLNFVYFTVNFLLVGVIFFHFLKENGRIALKDFWRCLRYAAVGLVLNWVLSFAVQFLIRSLDPGFFNVNDASISTMAQENYILIALGTVWLVPMAEETLYRGLMFGGLYNRSRFAAYAVSVCVFALVHVVGYIGQYAPLRLLMCFLQYLPAGIALGWTYAKTDTIWTPILMHIAFNQIGMTAMR